MSALNRIKGLILREMKGTDVNLKKAITRIINSIDTDLDVEGYVQSSTVDEAFNNLDEVLISQANDNEVQEEDDITDLVISERKRISPSEEDALS